MVQETAAEQSNQRKELGPTWRVVLNVLLIFLGSQVIAIMLVETALSIIGSPSGTFDNSTAAQFFYVLIAEGLAGGLVLLILRMRKLGLKVIGLGRRPNATDLSRALIGFFVFYVVLIAFSLILSLLFPDINNGNQDVGFNHMHGLTDSVLAFVALVFLPPLGEETLVRGYLYSGLRQKLRFVPAMILTSFLFGAAHLGTGFGPGLLWAAGANTFVLSLVLVYLREKTGALYAGMLIHALNNTIAFGFHFHAILF